MKRRVIFVDVDDTLVRSIGSRRIAMPPVIVRVRELHDAGMALYLWSSGGAEYARCSAAELGIGIASKRSCQNPTVTSLIRLSTSGAIAGMCFR
ncbi:MAG TPA: DUF705 domain-containing protein [Pseudoxanthomonas sp.]|nr:DUF705 domain-containing protein [Pseudoxanthomonas sp.]